MSTSTATSGAERTTGNHLSLLHGFGLTCDGADVPVAFASQRLLALLALRDRPTLRTYVGATLWLDAPASRANARLRSALWRTPTPDTSPLIVASATHLALDANVHVDYRDARSAATSLLADAAPAAVVPLQHTDWGSLADGLRSDLLPDWYDDWVHVERERFRQLRVHALEQLCTRLLEERRYGEALDAALAAVAIEPLRESGHRHVITVHLEEGNVVEAVRQFQEIARLLDTELGVEPSAALRDLIRDVQPR